MKNSKIALKAFDEFVFAFNKKIIKGQKTRLFSDIFVYLDRPKGFLRNTYFILSDTREIVAQCIIVELPIQERYLKKFQIGWCVDENYRNQGFGFRLVKSSIDDFLYNNQNDKFKIILEATVDEGNLASLKIAQAFFNSPHEILQDKLGNKVLIYQEIM